MRLTDLLIAAIVCIVWGLNAVAAKIGVTHIPPVFFTGLRFVFVLMVLSPWLRSVPGKWGGLIPAVFFMGGLHFALIFKGAQLSDASTMSIVNQLYVPFAALIAIFWLGERVPWQRWAGIFTALLGVAVFSLDATVSEHLAGVAFLIADGLAMAIGTVLLRRLSGVQPFVMQAWMAALGMPFLFAVSFLFEDGQWAALANSPWQGWAALAYTIIGGSLIGHTFYYVLLQRYEVSLVASVLLPGPAIGVLAGVVFLGEPFTPMIVLGSLLTIAGVFIVLRRGRRIHAIESAEGV
jgi:O-acetylserine/cysteine efflux transporter